MKNPKFLTQAAIIAAIYAALTIAMAPISYGPLQVRVSEALTVLHFFTGAAIPGLFIGCIIANLYGVIYAGGVMAIDILVGSMATLVAAYLSYKTPAKHLVPLPPILANGIIIGMELSLLYNLPMLATMGWVALGELIACYGLGYPLLLLLERYRERIF